MASTARLDELKKKFDENPRRYFAPLANEHRKSGDLDQAIALCRAHLPQQAAHISGHIVLGQALFEAAQFDESRSIFHAALDLDPENLIALRYLGDLARGTGDVPTARSWYQRVLEFDPRNDEIVQLVRELDAPSPAIESDAALTAGQPAESAVETSAPPVERAPSAPAPVREDSRFAPLSLDQIDTDSDFFAPSGEVTSPDAVQAHGTTAAPGDAAFDVDGSWSLDAPTVELPSMDAPEMESFDAHPAGADSLFVDPTAAEHRDLLMAELSGTPDAIDLDAYEAAPELTTDAWPTDAEEADDAPTLGVEKSEASFEAVSSAEPSPEPSTEWNEEPTTTPTTFSMTEEPSAASASAFDMAWDARTEEMAAPADARAEVEVPEAVEPSPASPTSPVEAPNAETPEFDAVVSMDSVAFADAPENVEAYAPATPVEDAPVAAASGNDLGLEVMEFVPPTGAARMSEPVELTAADPLVGHMPELTAPASGVTPAAFVTETMAELYLQQGFRNEALAVYRELLTRNPADTSLRDRIAQIENGSMSSLGMATLSENVVESARRRQTAPPTRSVRSFFASLAGRRAPHPQPREIADAVQQDAAPQSSDLGQDDLQTQHTARHDDPAPAATSDAAFEQLATPAAEAAPAEQTKSAAEQMASFDPFADNWDAPAAAPNAVEPMRPTPRGLEALFPEAPATPRADAAAQTLATAFGRTEPQGRPTRAANSELSLDRVFRGAPEGAPVQDSGFSFDQFFSDSRAATTDAAPAGSDSPDGGRDSDAGDTHDIEQFTAWLEGLKKK